MIQNQTTYYLITSGLDINPKHGPYSEILYNSIKEAITKKAIINYEHEIREFNAVAVNGFLETYNGSPRSVWQYLFGVEKHSNTWNTTELSTEIASDIYKIKYLNDDFCIDFTRMIDEGFAIYKNISNVWTKTKFYLTFGNLSYYYGNDDDVTFNINQNKIRFYVKRNGSWILLKDDNNVIVQESIPSIQNGYWIKNTSFRISKFSNNSWVEYNAFYIDNPIIDNIYVEINENYWSLFIYQPNKITLNFSKYPIQDINNNSWFNDNQGNNNFIIHENDEALSGGPLHVSFTNNQFYDIGITYDSTLDNSQVLVRYQFPSNVNFPINFQGSKAIAGVASSSNAIFSIRKNNIEIGSISFDNSLQGIYNSNNMSVNFNIDDVLTIICPNPKDSTLSSIGLSLKGQRF